MKKFKNPIDAKTIKLLALSAVACFVTSCNNPNSAPNQIETPTQKELESGEFKLKENALVEYTKLKSELDDLYVKKEKAYKIDSPDFKKLQIEYKLLKKRMDNIKYKN